MGKNAKLKEKQKWSHEKLHLENARKLRGIYIIDPGDKEFKETIKNARKKLETSVAPAMPCKIIKSNKNCGSGASNKHSVYTHFPKDRNCEICQRTKITIAPRRRRIGGAVHRVENFGDLITV